MWGVGGMFCHIQEGLASLCLFGLLGVGTNSSILLCRPGRFCHPSSTGPGQCLLLLYSGSLLMFLSLSRCLSCLVDSLFGKFVRSMLLISHLFVSGALICSQVHISSLGK